MHGHTNVKSYKYSYKVKDLINGNEVLLRKKLQQESYKRYFQNISALL